MLIEGVLGVTSAIMYVHKRKRDAINKHYNPVLPKQLGSARFAGEDKTRHLTGKGIRLGYQNGRALIFNQDSHAVLIAPAGAGKGTSYIIPNCLSLNDQSLFLIDNKCENTPIIYRHRKSLGPFYVINPYDLNRDYLKGVPMARYNPMQPLCDGSIPAKEIAAAAGNLAVACVYEEGLSTDSFWVTGSQGIYAQVIEWAARFGYTADQNLPAIARMLHGDILGLFLRCANCPDKEMAARFTAYVRQMSEHDRTLAGLIETLKVQTSFLLDPAIAEVLSSSTFRMEELKQRVSTVATVLPIEYSESGRKISRLMAVAAMSRLMRMDVPRRVPVVMICDEAAQYGRLDLIVNAYGMSRGYGVKMWTIWQDISQMSALYGPKHNSILANSGARMFIAPQDPMTLGYIATQAGTAEVVNRTKSVHLDQQGWPQTSDNFSPMTRPLLPEHEAMYLPLDQALVWVRGVSGPIKTQLKPYFKDPVFSGKYGPNPYVRRK